MSIVALGILSVFNHETQEWSLYKGRLEQWFLANDITEALDQKGVKRRAILLSSLSESTYRLVQDLAQPEEVGEVFYDRLIQLLDGHFKVKKCGFAERHKFHSAVQEAGETLAQWAARVRNLAKDCEFPSSVLSMELRDRFVLGMAAGHARDRVFTEALEGFTIEKALQLAESARCAREGARQGPAVPAVQAAAAGLDMHKVAAAHHSSSSGSRQVRGQTSGSSWPSAGGAARGGGTTEQCTVCGYYGHSSQVCKFKSYMCRKCGSKGHLKRVCRKSGVTQHFLQCCADEGDDGKRLIFNIQTVNGEPMQESISVENVRMTFELDTGSAITAISDEAYNKYFKNHQLRVSNKTLQSYDGSVIETLGILSLPFSYKQKTEVIDVYVVKRGGPPLLGRDFMAKFNLRICQIKCSDETDLQKLLDRYPLLFSEKLGCCEGLEVKLNLKPDSSPIYMKARPVPFALRTKIEKELNRLVDECIIEPVTFSEYASPIVPVLKHDGNIRLCADYSATLNKQLLIEKYPLPKIEELFAKLHGGIQFTKLDLSSAYNQLKLHKDSQLMTCINTHKGLYKYNRLVFGLSSAPAIFQRTLENILSGVDGVLQFLDDILITGTNKKQHLDRVNEVFRRLEAAGLVLRKDKCSFFQDSVAYLGFVIDKNGLHKSPEKVKAILEAKQPENVTELKSFLGLVNYYRNFIKNASSILSPLHFLLQKKNKWLWSKEQDMAFIKIKQELSSDNTLAHFNPDAQIILTVDASPFGLGAILSQIEEGGIERPISYVSRSLNSAEKQYSQIQKEATAIVFGVRKYHQYLYGRADPFILKTDHKPLLSIFQPSKGIPEVSANRLQRYALFLSAYNYKIEYVSSSQNTADFLSRAMVSEPKNNSAEPADRLIDNASYVQFIWQERAGSPPPPVSVSDVTRETASDELLSRVVKFVLNGWPNRQSDKVFRPYYECRNELSVESGCLMRGMKLVVPEKLKHKIFNELHTGHIGIYKMKNEARARFWWPGMATYLEKALSACYVCSQLRPSPHRAPLTPWPYPPEPWYRVHLDFLGPFHNRVYLVAVDAYSKWVEVFDVSNGYGTRVVIEKLCELMSRFGLINTLCTDNGTSFVSQEFENFCIKNGIKHITSPTYHPASNGQAESYVKIIKKAIKSILLSGSNVKDINVKLQEFLFHYRNSIHSSTNLSPAQVLFGRKLRCRLDLISPKSPPSSDTALAEAVRENQCSQVKFYHGNRKIDFNINEKVLVKINYSLNSVWTQGVIQKKLGKSAYLVKVIDSGRVIKRHKNQIYEIRGEEELIPDDKGCSSSLPLDLQGSNPEHSPHILLNRVPVSNTSETDLHGKEVPNQAGSGTETPLQVDNAEVSTEKTAERTVQMPQPGSTHAVTVPPIRTVAPDAGTPFVPEPRVLRPRKAVKK